MHIFPPFKSTSLMMSVSGINVMLAGPIFREESKSATLEGNDKSEDEELAGEPGLGTGMGGSFPGAGAPICGKF